MAGLIMRLREDGHKEVHVLGPSGLCHPQYMPISLILITLSSLFALDRLHVDEPHH